MAIVSIGSRPDLTIDEVWTVFARHFEGTYEIVPSNAAKRDFIVKKSDWAGVGVRLKQERTGTSFVFTGIMPNILLDAVFGGPGGSMFVRSTWKELEAEIAAKEKHMKAAESFFRR
jgi:hypothetical protein